MSFHNNDGVHLNRIFIYNHLTGGVRTSTYLHTDICTARTGDMMVVAWKQRRMGRLRLYMKLYYYVNIRRMQLSHFYRYGINKNSSFVARIIGLREKVLQCTHNCCTQ